MKWLGRLGVVLTGLLLAGGCMEEPQSKVKTTVGDVRITFGTTETKTGNPVVGAVVGGTLAGTPGAIVGALVADDTTSAKGGLVACGFTATAPDGKKFVFRLTTAAFDSDLGKCSLLRNGDAIEIACWPDGHCVWMGSEGMYRAEGQ